MRLLVLGGTSFVGRHLVFAARAAGLDVTLFNRGQTNPGLFADVEQIHGDRDGGLSALRPGRWDAVLDVNGYVPRVVRQSVEALAGAGHYTFISSISVYAEPGATGPDETSAVADLEHDAEEVTGETYGALKASCEGVVRDAFGAEFEWVPEQFLLDQGVAPWTDLPLWLSDAHNGMLSAPNERARRAGLTFRALEDTVRATWRWDAARSDRGTAGMSVERERQLLAAWDVATQDVQGDRKR